MRSRRLVTHPGSFAATLAAAALSFGAPLFAAEGDAPAKAVEADKVSEREEVIVVGSAPTPGFPILPANETEFRFKLSLTGQVVTLRWIDLEENERRRVQKLYGLEMKGAQKVIGEKIAGVRYLLNSGKMLEGMPLPERERPGQKAIKTAASPLLIIPEADIKSKEDIECYEGDFFSPAEIYQKWILEKPPSHTDAASHLAMAQRVANIGLFGKALDHLQMAAAIDPRTADRNKEFRQQLIEEDTRSQVQSLYQRLQQAKTASDWPSAYYLLDQLDRNFPNSDYKTRWDAMRPQIEIGMKSEIAKRVIQMAYTIASELVQQKLFKKVRVDEKGNIVPSIPGKQVTTRHGHVFMGTLESGEAGGNMVMKVGDVTTTISAKDVMSVKDIDLSKASKEINPAFDDLKDWVTDISRPDGLKMTMIAKISQLLKEPESKIKEIFDARLSVEATYKDGIYTRSDTYVTLHDASYGKGSWLREGSKIAPLPQNTTQNRSRRYRQQQQLAQGNLNALQKQDDPDENPETTDDPSVWWKFQNTEIQLAVLRAMAAEKVFSAKKTDLPCTACRGTGQVPIMASGGNLENTRCPTCRGMGVLFKLMYR
jgi:tetratricopeptide (TPR) repeat protein